MAQLLARSSFAALGTRGARLGTRGARLGTRGACLGGSTLTEVPQPAASTVKNLNFLFQMQEPIRKVSRNAQRLVESLNHIRQPRPGVPYWTPGMAAQDPIDSSRTHHRNYLGKPFCLRLDINGDAHTRPQQILFLSGMLWFSQEPGIPQGPNGRHHNGQRTGGTRRPTLTPA